MKALYPEYVGPDNAYVMLAAVYRRLSDPVAERKVLEELAAREGSASPAYLRMMELDEAAEDWPTLAKDARRLLAVNPLIPAPYRQLARASEHLGEPERGHDRLSRRRDARRYRPRRGTLPPGEAAQPGGETRRSPARGPQVARRSPPIPGRASAPARTGRTWRKSGGTARHQVPANRSAADHDTKTTDPLRDPCSPRRSPPASPWPSTARFGPGPHGHPRGSGRRSNWTVDERFKHDVFTFVRIEYTSGYGVAAFVVAAFVVAALAVVAAVAYPSGGYGPGFRGRGRGGRGLGVANGSPTGPTATSISRSDSSNSPR